MTVTEPTPQAPVTDEPARPGDAAAAEEDEALVVEELLVEEISIDGMCGVY